MSRGKSVTYVLGTLSAITHNESHVCDVALSPTRAKGHVAERRAAAPRSPSRPAGAAMYIRAVIRSCAANLCLLMFHNRFMQIGYHLYDLLTPLTILDLPFWRQCQSIRSLQVVGFLVNPNMSQEF